MLHTVRKIAGRESRPSYEPKRLVGDHQILVIKIIHDRGPSNQVSYAVSSGGQHIADFDHELGPIAQKRR